MKRRLRTFAALLALLTFSASFAEQAWAGTCAPAPAQAAGHHLVADSHVHAGGGTVETPSAPAPHHGSGAPDPCPLQAVTAGCALLLPPAWVSDRAPPAEAPRILISPHSDPSHGLLLVSSFFRPPQR